MAATGYTPIKLYASTTAAAVPLAANLDNTNGAELAINITDGKLYYKDNSGVVKLLASNATSAPVLSFQTSLGGLTPSTATTGVVTLAGTLNTSSGGTGLTSYTAGDLSYYASGTALTKLAIGTAGQILTSSGTAPQWSTLSGVAVTTFSAGTTGFTPSSATAGAVTLAGTLATTNGGTGLTSFTSGGLVYASSSSALATGSALIWTGGTAQLGFQHAAANGYAYIANAGAGTNTDLAFYMGATEGMRLTSTGLGIGTSSPSQKLQVTGAIYANNSTNVAFLMQGSQYNGSIANTSGTNTYSLGYSTNASTHTSVLYWNALGSVSVGIAPSAFTNGWSAIQIGSSALSYSGTGSFTSTQVSDNAYFIGSGSDTVTANYIYGSTPATNYKQYNGTHRWYIAPSGTAGNAISFTQAMTLDGSSNLYLGITPIGGSSKFTVRPSSTYGMWCSVGFTDGTPYGLEFGLYPEHGSYRSAIRGLPENYGGTDSGALAFYTSNSYNTGAISERMRIASAGNVVIGSTNADPLGLVRERNLAIVTTGTSGALTIVGGGNARIDFGVGATRTGGVFSDTTNFMEIFTSTALPLVFSTNSAQRARIDTSGNLLVGTTATTGAVSNYATVVGGLFRSFSGNTGAVASNTYTTLFTASSGTVASYLVTVWLIADDVANYQANVIVNTQGGTSTKVTTIVSGNLLVFQMSGYSLQAAQLSGAAGNIYYSVIRIAA
jgi:hypothetical protein